MQIWLRLLWREFRENSPFVLIGVLLPLVCLAFPIRYPDGNIVYGDIVNLAACIVIIMISVWASARAQETRDHGLPIVPPLRWATRYLIPMPGVLLIGAALGYLAALRLTKIEQFDMIPLTIGMCVFVYILCTAVSAIYALIPAVLVGISLALFSFFPEFYRVEIHWMLLRILLVVLVTSICLEGFRGRSRVIIGRIAMPLLVMAAFFWGSLNVSLMEKQLLASLHLKREGKMTVEGANVNLDGTLYAYVNTHIGRIILHDTRILHEYNIARDRVAPPDHYMRLLGCLERHVVLCAAQAPGDKQVRVIAWDARTGQVHERFRFNGRRDMLAHSNYPSPSPDGRYALLWVASTIGWGVDFWLIDLQRQQAALVIPNLNCTIQSYGSDGICVSYNTIWNANRLILESNQQIVSLDLHTLRVTPLMIVGQL